MFQEEEAPSVFQAARAHTAATGHVVILNGTRMILHPRETGGLGVCALASPPVIPAQ
jgi:hypothetical protein